MKITHKFFKRRAVKYKVLDPDYEQAEIKIDHEGTQGLIYVGTDGFDIREYEKRGGIDRGYSITGDTRGKNVRISLNSPLTLTDSQWIALVDYVNSVRQEARDRI